MSGTVDSTKGTQAVIAHFDPDNRLDPTFRMLLDCLKDLCERIVLVTTSVLPPTEIPEDKSIVTIQRPNIGYDFYSYRVGIEEIQKRGGCERLFVVNSSFLVLNRQRFVSSLLRMTQCLDGASIVGLTQSFQFAQHLQSYLLLISGEVLSSDWFQDWLKGLAPRNSKMETIMAGEFGLAQAIARVGISNSPVFSLTRIETWQAYLSWGRVLLKYYGMFGLLRNRRLRQIREFNPVHFAARPLAERCGLVKSELIRDNPHNLKINWVDAVTAEESRDIVQQFIKRSSKHYQSSGDGLTVLNSNNCDLPACKLIYSAPVARPGVHVAVVVHIYYPELIEEIYGYLRNILEPFDLFVTTPHEGAIPEIFNGFSSLPQSIVVALCENRGRDIGPFISIHRQGLLDGYQAVLKLHTKRSTYSDLGGAWRQNLFNELCGNSRSVKKILNLLRDYHVGLIGPHDYYLTHEHFWGADRELAKSLLDDMGVNNGADGPTLGFFAGSMFWFNPMALRALHKIPETHLTFEPEAGQQDGTLAHAFERIFCNIAKNDGYLITSLLLEGKNIHDESTEGNNVPVLPLPSNA